MHATTLAQIAANFAAMGHALTGDSVTMLGDASHGYWLANRFRCDAWHQRISAHRSAIERCGTGQRTRLWQGILPTLQEILISEPLSRLIAYLAAQLEQRSADADWGALSHSVLTSHTEARNRCLNLMVFGYGLPVERAVELNHLRRLLEFFNDQLLGALKPHPDLARYAFEPVLVSHTQRDFRRYAIAGPLQQVRLMSLCAAVIQLLSSEDELQSANPHLNHTVAETALAMWPPAIFDSFGVVRGRLHEAVTIQVNESPVSSDDFNMPLAAPFDVLAEKLRSPHAKTSRRF